MSDGQEIGRLQGDVRSIKESTTVLFSSMAKRKDENVDLSLNLQSLQHMIETTTSNVDRAVSGMDEIKKDIKKLSSDMTEEFSDLKGRVSKLEGKAFDTPYFMTGLYKVSQNKFLWIFLTVSVLVYGREYSIDIVRELSALFKTAKVSK